MKQSDPLRYKQLHLDRAALVPQKWSTGLPFEELLVFLEGAGLRNQNSQLTIGALLEYPPDDLIVIPFQGKSYQVVQITYPKNQQFARFHLIPA